MTPFLNKVAKYISDNFQDGFGQLCVVLPNRRASLFLKKYLTSYIDKATWAPSVFSIEDFVVKSTGTIILDRLSLIFELYEVHSVLEKEKVQPFEEFIKWGNQLLTDFNEIDLYLADPAKLYNFLDETRAMSVWNLGAELTEREKEYLRFYNSLSEYYFEFRSRLAEKRTAFQGMAYREMAEKITEITENLEWKNIVFAGFNALSTSEEHIINHLKSEGQAETLWDVDEYYISDKTQEAGRFLRNHLRNIKRGEINWLEDNFRNSSKKIHVIGVPRNIGQAKLMGEILTDVDVKDLSNTAVVLANESLLMPVLNSIPGNINSFNITMGMPLDNTSLFKLFDTLLWLHENAVSFSKIKKTETPLYYHRILLKLFSNYYIKYLLSDSQEIENLNLDKAFHSGKELIEKADDDYVRELFTRIFPSSLPGVNDIMEMLTWLLTGIRDKLIEEKNKITSPDDNHSYINNEIELEYIYSFSLLLRRIKTFTEKYDSLSDIRTLALILRQLVRQSTIPFYGEPLKGLQVMGMLETRTLDFENLILLSVNENILPAARQMSSFIPHEIRREFNLPTYKDKDSVFAYHFYRLLQRSKNVYLIYNTEADNLGSGEQSRFIKQIKKELPEYNREITINEKILEILYQAHKENPIIINKTDRIIRKLTEKAEKGFSPSALNKYIQCSLRFYFEEIEGLKEKEELEEEIDAKTYGIIIHDILHTLFLPTVNNILSVADLESMKKNLGEFIRDSFAEQYKTSNIDFGKNFLKIKAATYLLNDFIDFEIKEIRDNMHEVVVKELESWQKAEIFIPDPNNNGNNLEVRIKGVIDRIDACDGRIRIIDYKTGNVERTHLKIKDIDELLNDSKYSQLFQLLFYAFLYMSKKSHSGDISAGIYSLKDAKGGLKKIKVNEHDHFDLGDLTGFEQTLKQLLGDIFNKNINFTQTEEPDRCRYCSFVSICNRWSPKEDNY